MILESIATTAVAEAAKAVGRRGIETIRPTKCPAVKEVRFLNVLPRRIGLPMSLSSEDLTKATFGELHDRAFENGVWNCRWIDCAELFFRVENIDKHDSIYIRSIHIESDVTENVPGASLLQEPQGAMVSGECHRFVAVVDSDTPIMRKYNLVGQQVEFVGDQHYFECSTIEIPPISGANIALTLVVEKTARIIREISIVYGVVGDTGLSEQDVGIEAEIRICPICLIPEDQRFRTTWSNLDRRLASVTTESDESIIPKRTVNYRWGGYSKRCRTE